MFRVLWNPSVFVRLFQRNSYPQMAQIFTDKDCLRSTYFFRTAIVKKKSGLVCDPNAKGEVLPQRRKDAEIFRRDIRSYPLLG